MLDLSIVIVSWNARDFLRKCLISLQRATCELRAEIIVVDNASADDSPEMVQEEFAGVQLIQTGQNLGFAKGNNVGIRKSQGRFVALINSDVEVPADTLKQLIAFMDQNAEVGIAGPKIFGGDGRIQSSCFRSPNFRNTICQTFALYRLVPRSSLLSGWEMKDWTYDQVREVDVLSGCFWIVRKQAMEQVGLLDEEFFMYGEDLDWCHRFHKSGWRVMFCPQASAIHYGGGSSAKAPVKFFIEMQKANRRYWKKHYGVTGSIFFSCIIFISQTVRLIPRLLQCLIQPSSRPEVLPKIRRSSACLLWLLHLDYRRADR